MRLFKDKLLRGFVFRKNYKISTSSIMTKIYVKALKTSKKHIIESGNPRNDIFLIIALKRNRIFHL